MATSLSHNLFPPGEYIRDELDARGWTQEDLANIMGRPSAAVSQIVNGSKAITPQTAQQLSAALGTSAELWLNLENAYRLELDREDQGEVARRARIYEKAPVSDMVRRQWIAQPESTDELENSILSFFEISSLEDDLPLDKAARMSSDYSITTAAQNAWFYRAKHLAKNLSIGPFTKKKFEDNLERLRGLTVSEQELYKVPGVLEDMGIRFVVVQHLPKTRIDGAVIWLSKSQPIIALSLRYDRIDGFWHTLMHELMHVFHGDGLSQGQSIDNSIVGRDREQPTSEIEIRADTEASNFLVAEDKISSFAARIRPRFSKRRIIQFANLHQIHPGIVVGQLQYRGEIQYTHSREMLVSVRNMITETALTDGWGHFPQV